MNIRKSFTNRSYGVSRLLILVLAFAGACVPVAAPAPSQSGAVPTQAPPALTLEHLQNAEYQGVYEGQVVKLTDGKYEGEPFVEGGASRPTVTLTPFHTFGDLNADGVEDAAVALVESSGGSGTFWYLAVALNLDGQPQNVATHLLGDRTQVKTITIDEDQIIVEMVTHAPDDPMCCPSQEATLVYELQGDQLIQVSEETVTPEEPAALENTVWMLVSYGDSGSPQTPLEGSEITAVFDKTEGNVSGSAGCNQYFGSFEVNGSKLSVSPLASTMMMCPEEGVMDQEQGYLAILQGAESYQIEGDQLHIVAAGDRLLTYTAGAPDQLNLDALRNATYPSEWEEDGPVTLTDGRYEGEPFVEGGAARLVVTLAAPIAHGDLDGDGVDDTVVVLVADPGGSGTFFSLEAMRNEAGKPVHLASVSLGDRAQIESLMIEDGQIVLEMVTHGPDDPMCCPTQIVRNTYALRDRVLVEVASEVLGTVEEQKETAAPPELVGKVWYWQAYQDTAGINDVTVDDPAKYTLVFLPEGVYQLVADCNRGSGGYTAEGSRLTLQPGPMTLAACGPESLDALYLAKLGDVATYVLEDGTLYLNLKMDAGNMVFVAEATPAP